MHELFTTNHDEANRAAVATVPAPPALRKDEYGPKPTARPARPRRSFSHYTRRQLRAEPTLGAELVVHARARYHIGSFDVIVKTTSFEHLLRRFPEPLAAGFFRRLAAGEAEALRLLERFAAAVGLGLEY
jgi:hypothetical protein